MGTIDKLWVNVQCENCNTNETNVSLDKGSGWGGSHWNGLGSFSEFNVKSNGSGKTEPKVENATCKKCGTEAKIQTQYGLKCPKEFE